RMYADLECRLFLPDFLRDHGSLQDAPTAAFMGVGRIFQIWEPEAARQRRTEARQKSRRVTIPAAPHTSSQRED
ncbi:MAG: transcriptional regulator MraZ, partial [Acetobacter syzygii]